MKILEFKENQKLEEEKILRNVKKIKEIINRNKDIKQKMEKDNNGKYNKTSM